MSTVTKSDMKQIISKIKEMNSPELFEFTYLLAKEDLEIAESLALRLSFQVQDEGEQF